MKFRMTLISILIITILIPIAGMVIRLSNYSIDDVIDAVNNYKSATDLNGEIWQKQFEQTKNKIETLKEKKTGLEQQLSDIKDQLREVAEENNSKIYTGEPMSDTLAYNFMAESSSETNTEVLKFFVEDPTTFDITFVGKINDLQATLSTIRNKTGAWGVNIGNISIRQNFDAYDMARTYDNETRLDWYDGKVINALGEVIDIEQFMTESSEESGDIGILYSTISLNEVKFDEEGRDLEVLASNSTYEQKMSDALTNYANQLTIIEASDYEDEVKEEIRNKLSDAYNNTIAELKEQKEKAVVLIEAKFQQRYEDEKAKALQMIATYEENIKKLRSTIVDSSEIEYRMDITLRYMG